MIEAKIELLVLDLKSGRVDALGELYALFHAGMRKYAVLRVGDAMIAEDLVQNVWLQVSQRIMWLRDVSLFRSWLYRSLRWQIIDWQRKSGKEILAADVAGDEVTETENSRGPAVLPMLALLADEDREVVELFYLNDMSLREIGLIIDIPVGTVKSRLHRARTLLKKHVEDQSGGEHYD